MGMGRKTGVAGFVVLLAITVNHYRNLKTLTPVLEISTGKLQGIVSHTRGGKEVHEYLGIPFAKAPVGDLRFALPQTPEPWLGIHDASDSGPQCIQVSLITAKVDGKEECLNLNVHTPAVRSEPLPVMVWFHGGAFVFGTSGRYKGAYLLDENVVLVTANYRLASLGFLNTGDGDGAVRGNMGLSDQNKALQWVQENIKSFGGDPDKVTIFGESAGSASVGFHLLSPMSKGLFKRAIMESGSPLGNWAIGREPAKQARRFADKFGCSEGKSTEEMVACLREVDAVTYVSEHKEMLLPLREKITLFGPTIETVHDKNTFLGEEPLALLVAGRVSKVPLIIGANEEEGLLTSSIVTSNHTKLRQANDEWNFFASRLLGYPLERTDISEKIRNFYFGNAEDIGSVEYIQNYTNLFSDRSFFVPIHNFMVEYAKHAPVRPYLYSYPAEFSLADVLAATQSERLPALVSVILELLKRWAYRKFGHELPHMGICHGDELQLIFNWQLSSFITDDHKDAKMSKAMVKLWTDFVKEKDTLTIEGVTWPVVNPKEGSSPLQYLNIASEPRIENEAFIERIRFWQNLGV